MSASLVGSEMCIRDRPWPHDPIETLIHLLRQSLQYVSGETLKYFKGDPVSYTHLTLPTICSV
eukprot:11583654-Alexandrium_andersonii.AAC.1